MLCVVFVLQVCVGFQLLTKPESPAHVFHLLYQRMQRPPGLLFYDRACQLHTYSLKREPFHFQDTIFRVDITHATNHVACADTYNPKKFRAHNTHASKYTYINSQICEQTNALLKKIRGVSGFMTQERFLLFNRLLLYRHNINKKALFAEKRQKNRIA